MRCQVDKVEIQVLSSAADEHLGSLMYDRLEWTLISEPLHLLLTSPLLLS